MNESYVDVRGTRTRVLRGGEGTPVLFLHGSGDAGLWLPVYDELAKSHDVIRPDHPGFGWSDEDTRIDSVHDLAFFYLDLLDELGIERVSVIGSSLGGWIGADLADDRARPDRAPRADRRRRAARRGQRPARRVRARAGRDRRARLRRTRSTAGSAAERMTAARGRTRPRWSATSATGSRPLTSPGTRTSTTRSSSTACTGSRRRRSSSGARDDGLVPLAHGHRWTELIAGSRLEVVEDCGHLPQVEQPERFMALVGPFLRAT